MTAALDERPAPLGDAPRPPGFWRGLGIIAGLELRQRLRSRTLLILAIIWFAIIGAVTALAWITLTAMFGAYGSDSDGFPLFSLIVYFVLLFGSLVAPAVSAGSIGAERGQATLATTQVTLVGTWSILLGKALAAWITGIAFLIVASPFVVFSLLLSRASAVQLLMALLALAVQIGVFTIIGVGLSALINSQVFAIVIAYLLVALLSVGTLIAFGLALGASTRYVDVEYRMLSQDYWQATAECGDDAACQAAVPRECVTSTSPMPVTPAERYWWILALNPYVVVADMVPVDTRSSLAPVDLFGVISLGVRSLQVPADPPRGYDECGSRYFSSTSPTPQETLDSTIPVWWIGLGLQALLTAAALTGGYLRLRTPARTLPKGSRIA